MGTQSLRGWQSLKATDMAGPAPLTMPKESSSDLQAGAVHGANFSKSWMASLLLTIYVFLGCNAALSSACCPGVWGLVPVGPGEVLEKGWGYMAHKRPKARARGLQHHARKMPTANVGGLILEMGHKQSTVNLISSKNGKLSELLASMQNPTERNRAPSERRQGRISN